MKKLLSHTAIALVAAIAITGCSSEEDSEYPTISREAIAEASEYYEDRSSSPENPMFVKALDYAWAAMTHSQKSDICFLWEYDPADVHMTMRRVAPAEYSERDLTQFYNGVC